MKRLLVLLCACGGYSPQSYCEATYQETCHKIFQCLPTQTVYATEKDCVTQDEMQFDCSTIQESNICNGQGSAHFSSSAAAQCISDIRALSCDTLTSTGFTLPSTCEASAICH
jgi:hypothetical protein